MGFAGSMDSEPLAQVTDHLAHGAAELDSYYAIGAHAYKDGHCCTTLTRLDMRFRGVVVERLHCAQVVGLTRRAALNELLQAVTQALLDLDEDSL